MVEKVLEHLKKKHKGLEKVLKPSHVKSHLRIFINCLVENPAFDSQVRRVWDGGGQTHTHSWAQPLRMPPPQPSPPWPTPPLLLPPYPFRPLFPPQTKEHMTLKVSAFGSKCSPSDKFFKEALSCGVLESILSFAQSKQSKDLKKTDGSKKARTHLHETPKNRKVADAYLL